MMIRPWYPYETEELAYQVDARQSIFHTAKNDTLALPLFPPSRRMNVNTGARTRVFHMDYDIETIVRRLWFCSKAFKK